MPSTQLTLSGPVEDEDTFFVPDGRSHYKFDQRSVADGGCVVSFAKKPLDVENRVLYDMTTKKGDELFKLWDGKVVPNNALRLSGTEGEYVYAIFNVEGHAEVSKRAFPVPLEVAEKVLTKAYNAAKANPSNFGLKLNHADDAVRQRHQERLDALKWDASMCVRADKDGNNKPCVIKPKENASKWTLVPAKSVPKSSFVEFLTPKVPRVAGKRKGVEPFPEDVSIAYNVGPSVKRVFSIRYDEMIKMETHGGIATITEYMTPLGYTTDTGGAPSSAAAAADEDEEEE